MAAGTEPGVLIELASVPNLRDVGGYATRDGGRVRTGVMYRSTELGRLADEDMAAFGRLGIRTVFDLRTAGEREAAPDRLPGGTRLVVCDVLPTRSRPRPRSSRGSSPTPGSPSGCSGTAGPPSCSRRPTATSSRCRARWRPTGLFTAILEDGRWPALFHCTTGKDRTGWGAAALLTLLGVSEEDVLADYMITNRDLLPALQPYLDRFAHAGGDPALLRPVLGVETAYLRTAFDEMRTRFGTIERYFSEGLGIDDDAQERLRALLVAPSG